METTKAPETPRVETTLIGPSMVIKGELSCSEDLYIDGQVTEKDHSNASRQLLLNLDYAHWPGCPKTVLL
jgi:hypothetical protein